MRYGRVVLGGLLSGEQSTGRGVVKNGGVVKKEKRDIQKALAVFFLMLQRGLCKLQMLPHVCSKTRV